MSLKALGLRTVALIAGVDVVSDVLTILRPIIIPTYSFQSLLDAWVTRGGLIVAERQHAQADVSVVGYVRQSIPAKHARAVESETRVVSIAVLVQTAVLEDLPDVRVRVLRCDDFLFESWSWVSKGRADDE